jgi:DNA-binding CsgD family transcriptional regulator
VLDPARPPQPNRAAEALMAGWSAFEREGLLLLLSRIALGASDPMQWAGVDLCTKFEHAADGRIVHHLYLTAGTVGSGAWFQQTFKVTRREGEVCELLLKGLSDKQISKALNISYWTVRSHVGRVLDKLGIESRSAVATRVMAAR